ncbi:hypothetical protein Ddc_19159 [Ditylenchus destructor]|nr:hypothetical protein Ddc_19159 [Ditylenchus destructor]
MTVIAYSITAFVIMSIIYQVHDEFQLIGLEVLRLNNWPLLKDGRQIFVIGFERAICPLITMIIPIITMTIPIMYVCITFVWQVNPGQISALISSTATLITLVNPLTTIMCFRCYRQATIRHLSCNLITLAITPASQANSSNVISNYRSASITSHVQEIAQQKTTRIVDQQL